MDEITFKNNMLHIKLEDAKVILNCLKRAIEECEDHGFDHGVPIYFENKDENSKLKSPIHLRIKKPVYKIEQGNFDFFSIEPTKHPLDPACKIDLNDFLKNKEKK